MCNPVAGFASIGDLQIELVDCRWAQTPLMSVGWGATVSAIANAMVMLPIMAVACCFARVRVLVLGCWLSSDRE